MEPQQPTALELFYSYSHKDEELRDKLETHLAMLKNEGVIRGWHDRRIIAGQEWNQEIDEHLESADIILLLVSPDFLASRYCYDIEVRRAMKRHEVSEARVIPVILRPSDWTRAPFSKVQALPKDAKPVTLWNNEDVAFLDIVTGIRAVAEEIRSKPRVESQHMEGEVRPTPHVHIPDILRVSFVTRYDREGNNIVERLSEELAPRKTRLIALWGAGGVGKTAIAAEAARSLSDSFHQRLVWVSADGRDDFNLTSLLDEIATQLGHDELRKLTLDFKREQVRELVMTAPALVVLDNFETIEPGEAENCARWLAQPSLCSALITTRQKVEAAHRNIPIGPMQAGEALDLLQQLVREAHDPSAFENLDRERVIHTAESNPLVLQWIVGQIDLAQDAEEVLSELTHGEGEAAERVFNRSFELTQMNKGGRAVLLALSLFVPSATRKALAEVAGFDKQKDKKHFRDAVKTLSSLWLLRTVAAGERLAVEGLTRELTKARLSHDPRSKRILPRYVARFLRHAEANSEPTTEYFNAVEEERENLLNAIDVAFEQSDWKSGIRIYAAMTKFMSLRGYWDESLWRGESALNIARRLGKEEWIAYLSHAVGILQWHRGNLTEAHRLYNESLEINRKLGDQTGIAASLYHLAILFKQRGELEEAHRLSNESLEIERKLGNQTGIANALYQLAVFAHYRGELEEAHCLYNESLEISRKIGHQQGIANSLHQLAVLAQERGDLDEARHLYDESLEINRKLGNQAGISHALLGLGSLAENQAEVAQARQMYLEGLEISKGLGYQNGVAIAQHNLGVLALTEENYGEAEKLLTESLLIFRRLDDKQSISECLESLGNLRTAENDYTAARAFYDEALSLAEALGNKLRIASIKHSLGLLAEKEQDRARAVELLGEALKGFEEMGSAAAEGTREDLRRVEGEAS